jgi:dual specificity phosphatase 12
MDVPVFNPAPRVHSGKEGRSHHHSSHRQSRDGEENKMPEEYNMQGYRGKSSKAVHECRLDSKILQNPGKRDTSPMRSHDWEQHANSSTKEPTGFARASRADQQRILNFYGYDEQFRNVMSNLYPDRIRSRLYIGSMADAAYLPLLDQLRVTHVVNVAVEAQQTNPPFESHGISYLLVPLPKKSHQVQAMLSKNRFEALRKATKFIRAALRSNARQGACFIHCVEGLSRSAAVVAAYLTEYEGMSVDRATEAVKASHPGSLKPDDFQELLRDFHYHLLRG